MRRFRSAQSSSMAPAKSRSARACCRWAFPFPPARRWRSSASQRRTTCALISPTTDSVRRIEPYSLRQTAEGYFVLHAIRSDSGEHRSYRVDRMQGATVTSQVFNPRYAVELTSTGPLKCAAFDSDAKNATDRRAERTGLKDRLMSTGARFAERPLTRRRWTER